MRQRDRRGGASGESLRGAFRELGGQMPGFEAQLSRRHRDGRRGPFRSSDPGAVEAVAAPLCLVGDGVQVGSDGASRRGVLAESPKLRVVPVTAGFSGEDFPGQESFAPDQQ